MVTRQAPTMSVGVLPGFCIRYGLLVSEQGQRPRRPLAVVAWCSAPPGAWRLVHRQRRGGLPLLTLRGKLHTALTTRGVCHNESRHRGSLWEQ
jgi:hypothetical protein